MDLVTIITYVEDQISKMDLVTIVTYVFLVIAVCALLLCCLRVVGFGAAGVVAGSIASIIQAIIGNVAAGSAFAIAQSIGATGTLPCMIILLIAVVIGIIMYQFGWLW